jgi:hypothetical protein
LHDLQTGFQRRLQFECGVQRAARLRLFAVLRGLPNALWRLLKMSFLRFATLLGLSTGVVLGACGNGSSASESDPECPVGSEGCPCTAGGSCDQGLQCFPPICFPPDVVGTGGTGGGSGGAPTGGAGGSAGAPSCAECLASTLGSMTVECKIGGSFSERTAALVLADGLPTSLGGEACGPPTQRSADATCGQHVTCGGCRLEMFYSTGGYRANVSCGGGSEAGSCPDILAASEIFKPSASCATPGGATGPTICKSHSESRCSECESGEYCEPGSSSSGIVCLLPCDTDADCCPGIPCRTNGWAGYPAKICSVDGV